MSFTAPVRRALAYTSKSLTKPYSSTTIQIQVSKSVAKCRCFSQSPIRKNAAPETTTSANAPLEDNDIMGGEGGSGKPPRQKANSDRLVFPGAVNSKFISTLQFQASERGTAISTYRLMDTDGKIIDEDHGIDFDNMKDETLRMYKSMISVSIMDQIMFDSQRQGRISFYIVNAGEEGIAVGSAAALGEHDVIYAQYREAGVLMQKGYTLEEFMNQCFSNKNDEGHGRSMPIHYQSKRHNFHPISSTLATQLPHAAGAGYALKLEGANACSVAYFGEGAASEGDFHAALNIAATRKCPTLFICRNNGYAISTPTLEQYKGDGIASRGVGYGIDTIRVDGNDTFAVYRVTKLAREMAIKEQKPVLIEAMSYRVSHHSTSDDSFAYRARVEVEDWKRRDNPITRLRKFMEARSWWDQTAETNLRSQVRKDILKAFAKAEKEKKPEIRQLFLDLYDEPTEDLKEQLGELKDVLGRYNEEYDLSGYEKGKDGL